MAQRVDGSGNIQWTANGTAIAKLIFDQDPQICIDCAGGAIITWLDKNSRFSHYNVYAQHINNQRTLQWLTIGSNVTGILVS